MHCKSQNRYQNILATHLSSDAIELYDVDLTGSLAIVFGNEQNGISNELKDRADGILLFRRLACFIH
jgi:tRNA (guanosine-2'-O-)-methyltransferase